MMPGLGHCGVPDAQWVSRRLEASVQESGPTWTSLSSAHATALTLHAHRKHIKQQRIGWSENTNKLRMWSCITFFG